MVLKLEHAQVKLKTTGLCGVQGGVHWLTFKKSFFQAVFEEKGERPEHKLKPIIGEKVDSINYFDEQLRVC